VNDVDNDGGNNNDNDDDDDVVQVTYCHLTKLNWYVQLNTDHINCHSTYNS